MANYAVKNKLTMNDINNLNLRINEEILLIFKNTKGQDYDVISKLNPNIKIRIVGGLDEKAKPKYNDEEYYDRTIYTPREMALVLKQFETLEKGINPNWSDLEKALYMYDTLANYMYYENIGINYRDSSRMLLGLVSGKAVCAGFALIYKEAMERLGVECEYMNKPHHHAWNAVKINGVYYPVDLTWDCHNLKNKGDKSGHRYFMTDPKFFENEHHQGDDSEMKLPPNVLPIDVVGKVWSKVKKQDSIRQTVTYTRSDGSKYVLSSIGKSANGLFVYATTDFNNGNLGACHILYSEYDFNDLNNKKYQDVLFEKNMINHCIVNNKGYLGTNLENKEKHLSSKYDYNTFVRQDGSSFTSVLRQKCEHEKVNSYHIVEFFNNKGSIELEMSRIYTENDLISITSHDSKKAIADSLLTKERLKEKIESFGGYVGFLKYENGRYKKIYNPELELSIGNKVR